MIRATMLAALASAALSAAAPAAAQPPPAVPPEPTALQLLPARGGRMLTVTTPAFRHGDDIPWAHTQWKANTFPGLQWSGAPQGVKTYAVIMQDPDLKVRGGAVLHWTLFNIPASVTHLEPGMTAPPPGASYGPNYKGAAQAYLGPRTPPNRKDHYHFAVFALDVAVPAEAASDYAVLTRAMEGHVLASGEVVGLAQAYPPTLSTTAKDG